MIVRLLSLRWQGGLVGRVGAWAGLFDVVLPVRGPVTASGAEELCT